MNYSKKRIIRLSIILIFILITLAMAVFAENCGKTTTKISETMNKTKQLSLKMKNSTSIQNTENTQLGNYSYADKTTGNIIYESPNQKNKLYSLIGIIALILVSIATFIYKKYIRKHKESINIT
jgi:outer membrane lipoprotein-sorting protein